MRKKILYMTISLIFSLIALFYILFDSNQVKISTKSPDNVIELTIKTYLLKRSFCNCYNTISITYTNTNGIYHNAIHYTGQEYNDKIESIIGVNWLDSSLIYQAELENSNIIFDTLGYY